MSVDNATDKFAVPRSIQYLDYLVAFVLLGFCFFSFSYLDIIITGFHSLAYVKGHFLDFYDFNNSNGTNYLPSTYLFMALWQWIPYKFLHYDPVGAISNGMVLWLKVQTLLFAVLTAVVIRKIATEMGCGKRGAVQAALFWFTTPFAIFSLLIFSQVDIFTMFFMMIGIYYLIKRNGFLFSLYFGISITFKYFPALAFIPLLLLFEKNLLKIVGYTAVCAVPAAIEVFLYKDSPMFRNVFLMGPGGKLFTTVIGLVHVYPLIWSVATGFAYWLDVRERRDEFNYWVFYIPLLVLAPMFMLIDWYPQWFMILTPFLAMTTLYHKNKTGFFNIVEYTGYYCYIAYIVHFFHTQVDTFMFLQGGMGVYNLVELSARAMKDLFPFNERSWSYTAISAALLVHLLFKFPFRHFMPQHKPESHLKPEEIDPNHLRIRLFVGVMFFVIPAVLCVNIPNPALLLAALLALPLLQFALIRLKVNPDVLLARLPLRKKLPRLLAGGVLLVVAVLVGRGLFKLVMMSASFREAQTIAPESFVFKGGGREIFHAGFKDGYIGNGKDFSPISLSDTFTIEVAATLSRRQAPYAHIVGNHPGLNNFEGFCIQQNAKNKGDFSVGFGNGKTWLPGVQFTLPIEERFYLAVVVDRNKIKVYRDGRLVASGDATDGLKDSGLPLSVGNWVNKNRSYHGEIYEVRITAGPLSDGDIRQNARLAVPKAASL